MYTRRHYAPLLAMLLAMAACNDTDTVTTSHPLVLQEVRVAAVTRSAEPIQAGGFEEGDLLEAIITQGDYKSQGQYAYEGGAWRAVAPAYWQDGESTQQVTLRTPIGEENSMLPGAYKADNWHRHDYLSHDALASPGTTSYEVKHMMAQLCVDLKPGEWMGQAELGSATVTVQGVKDRPQYAAGGTLDGAGDRSIQLRRQGWTHYALLVPTSIPNNIRISVGNHTYDYGLAAGDVPLAAGRCTTLTLVVDRSGVEAIDVSGEPWQEMEGSIEPDTAWETIHSQGGDLGDNWPETSPARVVVTGILTEEDIATLNSRQRQLMHLYVTAVGSPEEVWEKLDMGIAGHQQELFLLHATVVKPMACYMNGYLTSAYLPRVAEVGANAFYANTALTYVSLPEAMKIGDQAFSECSSLPAMMLPKAVEIGERALAMCESLSEAFLPMAKQIGDYAFQGCTSLAILHLTKEADIGNNAFQGCTALTTLYLTDLTQEEFEADEERYANLGHHTWQQIYYAPDAEGNYQGHWTRNTEN